MRRLAWALALIACASQAKDSAWWVQDTTARTESGISGIDAGVTFIEVEAGDCEPLLTIAGNYTISNIRLCTEKGCFKQSQIDGRTRLEGGRAVVYMALSDAAFSALAEDNQATIGTDEGSLTISLQGSKAAMAEAYRACLRKAGKSLQPDPPTLAPDPQMLNPDRPVIQDIDTSGGWL